MKNLSNIFKKHASILSIQNIVVSAPSGLTLGGGFEVLVESNFVASHTNIVVGLVETIVGLIPTEDVKKCYGDGLSQKKLKKIQILHSSSF